MRRRRKRRTRSNAARLLLLAAFLAAAVVWAIYPRQQRPASRHATPASVAQASATPLAFPKVTMQPAPVTTPSESPQPAVTPAPMETSISGAKLAIIIDDCGQWPSIERGYVDLPIPLTLSVLPHVRYGKEIAQSAADAGKGVMLHLPMEPLSRAYPGPGEIKTGMTDEAVTAQTQDDIAQVPPAKGVNNHEGSAASADTRVMRDVMAVVKNHGLFFVDSRTNPQSVGAQTAQDAGVPNASRDVFLDNQADIAYTKSMLERAVEIAKRNGSAIAIGHPKRSTLEALREMYPKIQAEGIEFVLAEQLVR